MDELLSTVDWSRAQFALTAIVHWLFVPLSIGLSLIVGIMETIYLKTGNERWKRMTKFWMLLFGINFACGVATGIILEFEFGTNWSNYSWFVGDIFGAPLAIEGILAFFLESTFIAVMFFGWNRVSRGFHLTATWLTAAGVCLSAYWILVANAWMQYPVGMEFDPAQMRNVMVSFADVALSPVAVNKFFHAVFSGWALSGVFVIGVSCYMLWRKRNVRFAVNSIKAGAWFGLAGMLLTMQTGDGSAVEVARHQPMKLAAIEGLYKGSTAQSIVAAGLVNPDKRWDNNEDEYLFAIEVPYGLSILAKHDPNAFVPGIADIINGIDVNEMGDTVNTVSYAERIRLGKLSHEALRAYDIARANHDAAAMEKAENDLRQYYPYFGYGYFNSVDEAIPPVAVTFYSFRVMVVLGSYFLLFFIVALFAAYRKDWLQRINWLQWVAIVSVPLMWICSEAGWMVAEVGRQPWTVQDLLPTKAAISEISSASVITTFWLFAVIFTVLLVAEVSIMLRQIDKKSQKNLEIDNAH